MFLGKGEDIVVQEVPFVGLGTELHDKDEYAFSAESLIASLASVTGLFVEGCKTFEGLREGELGY